jgi:hypothetical protein
VKQVLPTLPENLASLVFNEVHVAESSVFCVAFYRVFFVLLSALLLDTPVMPGSPEGWAVPASLVAPIVILLNDTNIV